MNSIYHYYIKFKVVKNGSCFIQNVIWKMSFY